MVKKDDNLLRFSIITIVFWAGLVCPNSFAADDRSDRALKELVNKYSEAMQAGLPDEAIAAADKMIKMKPDVAEIYYSRGVAFYVKNPKTQPQNAEITKDLLQKAINSFDTAIKLKPDYTNAFIRRGWAKEGLGLYDGAIADYSMALKFSPNEANAYLNRGQAYQGKEEYARAIADFSRVVELNPQEVSAYINRGNSYNRTKQYDLAIKDFSRAMEISTEKSDLVASYVGRGTAYMAKGQNSEAFKDFEKSKELMPENEDLVQAIKGFEEKLASTNAQATPAAKPAASAANPPPSAGAPATSPAKQTGPPEVKRVLTPFAGYAANDPCKSSDLKPEGVPWGDASPKSDGPVDSSQLGQYQALLRHTMQGLRLLYGPMSKQEDSTFDAFWAPFFDNPTNAALEYFKQIVPLLDDLAATANNLDGMLSSFGVGLQQLLLVAADPTSNETRMAGAQYQSVVAQRTKLDELLKRIDALGAPPNPLAAKCSARNRHRKVVAGQVDPLEIVKKAEWLRLNAYPFMEYRDTDPKAQGELVEMRWEGNTFHFSSQSNSSDGNYNSPCDSTTLLAAREETTGVLSADGSTIEKLSYKYIDRDCDKATHKITTEIHSSFEVSNIPMGSVEIQPDRKSVEYDVKGSNIGIFHDTVTYSPRVYEFVTKPRERPLEEIQVIFGTGIIPPSPEITKEQLTEFIKQDIHQIFSPEISSSDLVKKKEAPAKPTPPTPQATKGDQQDDPQAIKEAIDQHLALAEQARRDAERWKSDASAEKNEDRRKELLNRAADLYNDAQAEKDIAESLRTGTIVHTRTEWDESQHQALIDNAKKEVALFALEDQLLTNIPKVGDMISGVDGVELREQTQQRISDAIKSPNRLQNLAAIYSDLQNKVVNQGEQEMASAEAKIQRWDSRIAAAEDVQTAASVGIMLAGLWDPTAIGSLGLGYAGATGFAEGGVKGAALALTRSVSTKADAIISAFEGATRIDPETGEPAGLSGAIEGALWSIGTNKAFEMAGARIQKVKAEYALARQAAGGLGYKAVARATREARIKEFDFKTSEERYHSDLEAAKTPEEIAAVKKKHAIQVEREAMTNEKEAAKQKAENDIRQGMDPAKVKENYNKDLAAINEKYKAKETRNKEHEDVMKELGFDSRKPTPEEKDKGIDNRDIKATGSDPETASSDMDFTPQGKTPQEAYEKGKAYTEAMQRRGHNVVEYGDRWVDTTTDATIWKPGFGADKPGSSSFDAEVIFGTLPHSDKFGTKGGIEFTSTPSHTTDDPLGAVLANAGKAAAAGLGNSRPKDLHTVGKSAAKAAQAARIEPEPFLDKQIKALQAHQTPEQAGIVDLGADQATKDKQIESFLRKVASFMGRAYRTAEENSNKRSKELKTKAAEKPDQADSIRAQLAAYAAGNDAALTTIAQAAPGLAKAMAPLLKASDLVPEISTSKKEGLNVGGFARALLGDREDAAKASPPPADPNDPAFAGLSKRCQEAAKRVQEKLTAAKPGTEEAKYLAQLKTALEQGGKNPAEAVRNVRGISGTELSAVLMQLGVPATSAKTTP